MKKLFSSKKKTDYYLIYTLIFGIFALILYLHFYLNGKSLIWSHDGVPQHLNSLAYYGEYLRKILHTVFVEHKLSIPMWDMHIGYGSDILTTLHYYVIGDPLTLLSVFVPAENTELLYEFLIFHQDLSGGDRFQQILLLSQQFQRSDVVRRVYLYFCRLDDLCGYEASLLCQSYDLPSSDIDGNR